MKKILIIALAGIIIALTACNSENGHEQLSLEITFTGAVVQPSAPAGAIGAPWTAEHSIGISMGRATNPGLHGRGDTLPLFAPENLFVANKQFVATPGSRTTFSPMNGVPLFFDEADTARRRFVAYRPFSNSITADFRKPINISDQSNLVALEVLYAKATREEIGFNRRHEGPIHLEFTQQLTKLVFNISNGEGVTEPVANGLTVRITNQNTTGYMVLEDGSLETTGDLTNITVMNSSVSGGTFSAQAIVFPGYTADTEIEITNNAGEIFRLSVPGSEWIGSYIYTYDIRLSNNGGTAAGSSIQGTIQPWLDGGNINVLGVGNPLTFVLNLEEATWENAFIYEIWADGVKVGQLCLEFLHNDNVRRQTVVAYTMLPSSDRANLATGLVVDNGNFVEWNPNVTLSTPANQILLSYATGETVTIPPTTIFLQEGGSRWTTIDPQTPGVINATLKPFLLVDERSGPVSPTDEDESEYEIEIYRIVKIGTQYWIADNLRTRRFADGMPILTNVTNAEWNVRGTPPGSQAWAPAMALSAMLNNTAPLNDNNANSIAPGSVALRNTYGVLYNFPAVINFRPDGHTNPIPTAELVDRISPDGWSIPRREQFEILYRYVHQIDAIANRPASPLNYFRGNETGFSARGGRQRTGQGTWVSDNAHFMMIDTYVHVPNAHATNFETWHIMTTFRINLQDGVTTNSAHFPANISVATGNYIRLIRD